MSAIEHQRAMNRERQRRYRERKRSGRLEVAADPEAPEMSAVEFRRYLESGVRAGSIQAMKLWAELYHGEKASASSFGQFLERRSA